jgi:Zn-dependent protease with chaperone function
MNSKHFQIILFLAYAIFSAGFILFALKTIGVPISPVQYIVIIVGWVLYCVGIGPYFSAHYLFLHSKVRKPTLVEENLINALFSEVQQRTLFTKRIRLWVSEDSEIEAFAIGSRTIAISKGMLKVMTHDEIKGIMAHELGHLESWDCRIVAAYSTARKLLCFIRRPFIFIISKFKKRFTLLLSLICLLYFVYVRPVSNMTHTLQWMIITAFILGYPICLRLVNFFWQVVSRFREYRQDAFAHSIGYGQDLLNALHKLTLDTDMPVNRYRNLMSGSHPIIYNRIRRLERLLGLRDQ